MARKKTRKTKSFEILKFKKFAGKICRRLSAETLLEDLREGDYIIYWDGGQRVGKVKKNHKGYKHQWIKIYESRWKEHVLCRAKKIKPDKVREGWRDIESE